MHVLTQRDITMALDHGACIEGLNGKPVVLVLGELIYDVLLLEIEIATKDPSDRFLIAVAVPVFVISCGDIHACG